MKSMKLRSVILALSMFCFCTLSASSQTWDNLMRLSPFERTVRITKYYEQWHTRKSYPYIGYGHRIQPGEKLEYPITVRQADSLLRSDLMKHCALFRKYGADSLLLACVSYNCGPAVLLGSKKHPKSNLLKKLDAGKRDILTEYLGFSCYNGKPHAYILRRRWVEYQLLFEP